MSWTAPGVCPDQALVVERIEEARGGPLADDAAVDFVAEVSEQADGRLRLTVRGGDEGAGRTLTASDCEELAAALGQIVSLALGPHVPRESPEPPAEPASEIPEGREAMEERPSRPATLPLFDSADDPVEDRKRGRPPDTDRTRKLIGMLGVFDGSTLGTASLGVQVEGGMRLGSFFELRTVVGYIPSQAVTGAPESAATSGYFSLEFAGVMACAVWRASPWRVPVCGGMEAGRLSATGLGVTEPETEDVLWLAARTDARLGVELTAALRANLLAGLIFPLLRHEFTVANAPLHQLPALSPRAGLGLEYGF